MCFLDRGMTPIGGKSGILVILSLALLAFSLLFVQWNSHIHWNQLKSELASQNQVIQNKALETVFAGNSSPVIRQLMNGKGSLALHWEFVDSLSDSHPTVRRSAAFLLGILQCNRSVEPLISHLENLNSMPVIVSDTEGLEIEITIDSLEKITGRNFGTDIVAWRRWIRNQCERQHP